MMKALLIAMAFVFTGMKTDHKEYYYLVGDLPTFTQLKTTLLKDSVANKKLIQWIDANTKQLK